MSFKETVRVRITILLVPLTELFFRITLCAIV